MKITRKELGKYVAEALKKHFKSYGYRKRSFMLYKRISEYFVSVMISESGINNNLVSIKADIKPYCIDDLFWEVFECPENSKEADSLRAIGAFTVRGMPIYEDNREITDYAEVEGFVAELLKKCDERVDTLIQSIGNDFRAFLACSADKAGWYNPVLVEMLLDIQEGNYVSAKKLALHEIENRRCGGMACGNKDIYEYVVGFCKKKVRGAF